MLKTTLRTAMALSVLTAALSIVVAQGTVGRKEQRAGSNNSLRAKSILGSSVQLQGNASAGTIEDIVFDDEGVIDYFIVSQNGKLVTVPWEAAKFNFEKRTAVINITQEQFQKIPTYTSERYPEFYAPTYQKEVYGYYNVKPGQERRLERRLNRR